MLQLKPDSIQLPHILLLQMSDPQLMKISKNSIQKDIDIKLYLDRFDLVQVIKKLFITNSLSTECDPLTLISLMTWKLQPLPEYDCKLVLDHFKSVDDLFKVSKDALKYSLDSLKISDKSRQSIFTFLTTQQDYYID